MMAWDAALLKSANHHSKSSINMIILLPLTALIQFCSPALLASSSSSATDLTDWPSSETQGLLHIICLMTAGLELLPGLPCADLWMLKLLSDCDCGNQFVSGGRLSGACSGLVWSLTLGARHMLSG